MKLCVNCKYLGESTNSSLCNKCNRTQNKPNFEISNEIYIKELSLKCLNGDLSEHEFFTSMIKKFVFEK